MSNLTFPEFRTQAIQLYRSGAHAEALSYVEGKMHLFPDRKNDFYLFRVTTAALSGQTDHAIALIREVVEMGAWIPERTLRNAELQSLQGIPAFEELAARSKAQHEAAMAKAVPYRDALKVQQENAPLLIAMHGNGGTVDQGRDFWAPMTEQGWQVALLQSSQLMWPNRYVWDDIEKGAGEVVQHFAELTAEGGFDVNKVVLTGFSMGGGLSMRLAMSGEVPARGFVAIGPWLPSTDQLKPYLASAKERGVRCWIQVNADDEVCLKVAEDVHKMLQEADIPCVYDLHADGGHDYPKAFDMTKALKFVLGE